MAGEAFPTRLENLAREAAFKLKRAEEYRTSAAILLGACRERVDAGDPEAHGAAWAAYARVRFSPWTPGYIDGLIDAGAPSDDRQDQADAPSGEILFDRAWAAFVALDPDGQQEFLRCAAAYAIHPDDPAEDVAAEQRTGSPSALDWLA